MFAGDTHHSAARMTARSTQVQSWNGRAISRSSDEELVEAHCAVEDVASC